MIDSSQYRLLIVMSEPVLCDLVSFRLDLLGYEIEKVCDGASAMASIADKNCNLLIMDTSLPDGDGLEWLARLRGQYNADDLPVIVFSLDPSLETVERSFHAGAQDYLITPFDPTVMEEKIEKILAERQPYWRGKSNRI